MTWPSNYLAVSYSQCDLGQREFIKTKQNQNQQINQTKKPQAKQWAEIFSLKKNKKKQ